MTVHNEIPDAAGKPITGRHVFYGMVAFFGVIVSVNFTMAMLAGQTWTGLEVKNSYVASQDYNDKLDMVERQKALGWKSNLTLEGGEVQFSLVSSTGKGIAGAKIEAQLRRPVLERDDRMIEFREVGPADYRATAPVDPGIWDIDVRVRVPGQGPYRQIFRIHVKE